jgi:uncharacterized protein YndB with AHSA1/START domain
MRIQLTATRTIAAPPAAVFALALDPARFPAFFRGFGPIPALRRITANAPPAVGGTRELESSDGSRLLERITVLDPPHRHAYTLAGLRPPLGWLVRGGQADWRFAPVADGTRVQWDYDWELTSTLALPVAWPLLQWCMRTAMRRCLHAMARAL